MSNHARHRSLRNNQVAKVVGTSGTILSLGAALVAVAPGTAGAAAPIVVNSAADNNPVGAMSLREAVVKANTDAGADIITFAPGLSSPITLNGGGGDIEIDDDLTIQGPGAGLLTVAGGGGADDRVFTILETAGDVTISGLTVTGGHSTDSGGGGIYSFTKGSTTLTNLHVTGNDTTGSGGGVVIWGNDTGSVTVTGSTFDHNEAGSHGGGMHVYDTGGPVNITGNTFDHNYAGDYGGGLALYRMHDAATVSGTFTNNDANNGGGISLKENYDATSITGAFIDHNHSDNYGGGIRIYDNVEPVTITGTTISENTAGESGGGVSIHDSGDVDIIASTISGNYASVDGGGVYQYSSGTLTITNSTISGNEAQDQGGGIMFAYQDTSEEEQGELVLAHSTVTLNIAGDEGGGLYLGSHATIDHTILAGNTGGDADGENDSTADVTFSLIGDADMGNITDTVDTNTTFNTDPLLAASASNGGPTQTHALLVVSPALNSGDPAFTPPPSTDQRGEPRVAFVVIDKGAYEAQPDEPEEPPAAQPVAETPRFTG